MHDKYHEHGLCSGDRASCQQPDRLFRTPKRGVQALLFLLVALCRCMFATCARINSRSRFRYTLLPFAAPWSAPRQRPVESHVHHAREREHGSSSSQPSSSEFALPRSQSDKRRVVTRGRQGQQGLQRTRSVNTHYVDCAPHSSASYTRLRFLLARPTRVGRPVAHCLRLTHRAKSANHDSNETSLNSEEDLVSHHEDL